VLPFYFLWQRALIDTYPGENAMTIKQKVIVTWLAMTVFILHYGFIKLPFENLTFIQVFWFIPFFLYHGVWRGNRMIRMLGRNGYQHYLLLLMSFPFVYAWVGYRELGQTYAEGVMAGRPFFWIFVLLVIIMYEKTGKLKINDYLWMLEILSWVSLISYLIVIIFADLSVSRMYDETEIRGVRLRFDCTFIAFGFFYYFIKGLESKNGLKYFMMSSLFLLFIAAYVQSRAILAALVLSLLAATFIVFDVRSKLKLALIIPSFVVGLVLYFGVIDPESTLVALFRYVFDLFISGYSDDYSISHRAFETLIASQSISERPMMGVGMISHQSSSFWDISDKRMNIADVGIQGIIMQYGFVGAFILFLSFVTIYKLLLFGFRQKTTNGLAFTTISIMNFYMFFMCIFTAAIAYMPMSVLLFSTLAALFVASSDTKRSDI